MAERIALSLIDPNPWQPRMSDDPEQIEKLARLIGQDGLLQPPAARHLQGVAAAWGVKLWGDWIEVAGRYEPEGYTDLVAAVVSAETGER